MKDKRILISGAGIAGFTLAYWLKQRGFSPTIIERCPFLMRKWAKNISRIDGSFF